MEFWDAVSKGMGKLADKLDALTDSHRTQPTGSEFSVLDRDYCWEDLDYAGTETLQRHVVSGQCRIVDKHGLAVEYGTQAELEQSMIRRTAQAAAVYAASGGRIADFSGVQPVQAKYGDIIGVVRKGGAYAHYGIYCSDTCIVHYAIPATQMLGYATVHATDLKGFLRDDKEYFVMDFPQPYQPPVMIGSQGDVPHAESVSEELARHLQAQYGYHLYTPEETVQRARSRLGETNYRILTNNCEHFAIWCKTGVSESMQVTSMLYTLGSTRGWTFRRPVKY